MTAKFPEEQDPRFLCANYAAVAHPNINLKKMRIGSKGYEGPAFVKGTG